MAGYSGTPLAKKLGVKEGSRVAVINAPREAGDVIVQIGAEAPVSRWLDGKAPFDVIVLFCRRSAELEVGFERARLRMAENGGLWVAWPKKTSGLETDLNENIIRAFGLETGLVDNKVCAVDEVWSGLRFVVRVKDRKK